jgi:surface antigen
LTSAHLAACSIAMPSSPRGDDLAAATDVTGSIRKPAPEFARGLEPEDTRRARAALATALDPQGSGERVDWDNPQTGARGVFTPVGQAYPSDGRVCRAFLAEIVTSHNEERLQGTACRDKSAEWTPLDVKPWKKG